jgi:hypothetical protein
MVPLPALALGLWCLFGPRPEAVGAAAFSTLRAQLRTDYMKGYVPSFATQ